MESKRRYKSDIQDDFDLKLLERKRESKHRRNREDSRDRRERRASTKDATDEHMQIKLDRGNYHHVNNPHKENGQDYGSPERQKYIRSRLHEKTKYRSDAVRRRNKGDTREQTEQDRTGKRKSRRRIGKPAFELRQRQQPGTQRKYYSDSEIDNIHREKEHEHAVKDIKLRRNMSMKDDLQEHPRQIKDEQSDKRHQKHELVPKALDYDDKTYKVDHSYLNAGKNDKYIPSNGASGNEIKLSENPTKYLKHSSDSDASFNPLINARKIDQSSKQFAVDWPFSQSFGQEKIVHILLDHVKDLTKEAREFREDRRKIENRIEKLESRIKDLESELSYCKDKEHCEKGEEKKKLHQSDVDVLNKLADKGEGANFKQEVREILAQVQGKYHLQLKDHEKRIREVQEQAEHEIHSLMKNIVDKYVQIADIKERQEQVKHLIEEKELEQKSCSTSLAHTSAAEATTVSPVKRFPLKPFESNSSISRCTKPTARELLGVMNSGESRAPSVGTSVTQAPNLMTCPATSQSRFTRQQLDSASCVLPGLKREKKKTSDITDAARCSRPETNTERKKPPAEVGRYQFYFDDYLTKSNGDATSNQLVDFGIRGRSTERAIRFQRSYDSNNVYATRSSTSPMQFNPLRHETARFWRERLLQPSRRTSQSDKNVLDDLSSQRNSN